MRIFIAGATGVLGRRMVRQFTDKNHRVIGLARDEKGKQTVQKLGGEAVIGDIYDADSIARLAGQADAATSIPVKVSSNPGDWAANDRLRREGTRALTEAAAKLGAQTYIQQSIVWVARPNDDSFFDEQTVTLSDGGGEFYAARVPVVGREKVALFLSRLVQGAVGIEEQTRVVELNGGFALITERSDAPEGVAPKRASLFELDNDGLIRRMYFVLASRKLTALRQ